MTVNAFFDQTQKRIKALEAELAALKCGPGKPRDIFAQVVAVATIGISVYDAGGRCIESNEAMGHIIGAARAQVLAQNFHHIGSWKVSGLYDCAMSALEQNTVKRHVVHTRSSFGRKVALDCHLVPFTADAKPYLMLMVNDISEQTKAEEKLRRSELRYRRIFESTSDLIWATDSQGGHIHTNQAIESILGYAAGEVRDAALVSFIHPDDREKCERLFEKAARQGRGWQGSVLRWQHKDGRTVYLESSAEPHFDEHGAISGFAGIERDLTDRLLVERTQKTSDEIVKAIPSGLFIYRHEQDDRLTLIGGNPAAEKLTGVKLDRHIGEEFNKLWPEALADGIFDRFLTVAKTGEPFTCEELVYKDEKVDGAFKVTTVSLPDHKLAVAFEDITERVRTAKALKASEKRYREIFNSITDVFYRTDMDGTIQIVSPSCRKIFGYAPEEVIGTNVRDYHVDSSRRAEFVKLLIARHEVIDFESALKGKGGRVVWVSTNAQYYTDGRGRIAGVQGISRDITDRRKADAEKQELEAQLRQAHKMEAIGTLAGGIAHDFNNILGIIIGNTELAMDDVPEQHSAWDNLKEIRIAATRARDVVKQLLAFSRKTERTFKPEPVVPIVTETLKLLRATLPQNIEIQRTIDSAVPFILGDATQIHQVLLNLCTNAAHAMAENGGTLTVEVAMCQFGRGELSAGLELAPGAYVWMRVRDTGIGIPREDLDRIFDPYFTTKEVGKGSGMGLSIVHGIVRAHGGGCHVDSIMGQGTVFDLYFPAIAPEIENPADPVENKKIPGGRERILFVDDETAIVDVAAKALARLGYLVTCVTDPVAALTSFQNGPESFDLVITDMSMPKMTGDRLAAAMFKIRPDVPILLCTGFSERIDADKAQRMGIRGYVEKPFDVWALAVAVRRTLSRAGRES